jgi:hypothetical protein
MKNDVPSKWNPEASKNRHIHICQGKLVRRDKEVHFILQKENHIKSIY